MLRFLRASPCCSVVAGCRRWIQTEEPCTPEGIRELIRRGEKEQLDREKAVDSRKVIFTSAASADHRPRIAAAEAFDVAAAALPRPPNFCYATVSLDYEGMVDAPEVVWFNLCRANGVSPSSAKRDSLHMMGGMVSNQRLGGGYIQVVLGSIPDLEVDSFTFDTVPSEKEIHVANRPPPALCFAMIDTSLCLQYEQVLSSHLNTLGDALGKNCPLVGGLYPPVESEKKGSEDPKKLGDSIFFVNDRVYKGSAAAVILRSKILRAEAFSVVPSISLGSAVVDKVTGKNGAFCIAALNGMPATEAIRRVYEMEEICDKPCKVFLGLKKGNVFFPVSFTGNPERGEIHCISPSDLTLKNGDAVELLVDDAELDTETSASLLISLEKKLSPVHVEKDINIAREARRNIIASSTAAFHFSQGGLNAIAKPDMPVLSLGNTGTLYSPSVLQRCVGRTCPNSGFFSPGQVGCVEGVTSIFARSSTYCFLEGKE